ncbi:MAG: Undecaprenyl-diphosphatase BcrC [bacterium ADurb.Bin400]|nr:MAG: Undecaprenyl-diphosphatase BcrC [bacterium ADurb.Bin400]
MESILNIIREYDFAIYYALYQQGLDSSLISWLNYIFAKYGIVLFILSFSYLIWKKRINAFLCSFSAMAIGGLIDLIIFVFWRRPRPFVTHGDVIVPPPMLDELSADRMSSFPSSHTYIVFAIAVSVYLYGHKRLGSVLFILAIFTALGRIGTGLHYPSDTIGGALLGILSGIIAYRIVHQAEKNWRYDEGEIAGADR